MISVLVLANNSLLGEAIVSVLADEIDLGPARVSNRELGRGNPHSLMIFIDEGEPDDELLKLTELFRNDVTLIVIKISLKSQNIYLYESYQLNNPGTERVINVVTDFLRVNLKKNFKGGRNTSPQKKIGRIWMADPKQHKRQQTDRPIAYLYKAAYLSTAIP